MCPHMHQTDHHRAGSTVAEIKSVTWNGSSLEYEWSHRSSMKMHISIVIYNGDNIYCARSTLCSFFKEKTDLCNAKSYRRIFVSRISEDNQNNPIFPVRCARRKGRLITFVLRLARGIAFPFSYVIYLFINS